MTAITINIPNHEVSFFKKMVSKMGWTYSEADVVRSAATAKEQALAKVDHARLRLRAEAADEKERTRLIPQRHRGTLCPNSSSFWFVPTIVSDSHLYRRLFVNEQRTYSLSLSHQQCHHPNSSITSCILQSNYQMLNDYNFQVSDQVL